MTQGSAEVSLLAGEKFSGCSDSIPEKSPGVGGKQ